MTLATLQSVFAEALAAAPLFASRGMKVWNPKDPDSRGGIMIEGRESENRQGFNEAIARFGFVVMVGRPKSAEFQNGDAFASGQTVFPVTLSENEERNWADDGAKINHLEALESVIDAVITTDTGNRGQRPAKGVSFQYGSPAEGLVESVASFRIPLFFRA